MVAGYFSSRLPGTAARRVLIALTVLGVSAAFAVSLSAQSMDQDQLPEAVQSASSIQDSKPDPATVNFSGHLDTSMNVVSATPGDHSGAYLLGLGLGNLDVAGGTKDARVETRIALTNYPEPALSLDRLSLRFRFSGFRGLVGLSRVAWGPGFVFVAGDLLFDSTGLGVNLGADDIRSDSAWLSDFYITLGDEAFLEAAVLSPATTSIVSGTVSIPGPGAISDTEFGARVSLSPGGIGLEAGYAFDGKDGLNKAALSTQFHAGIDWYLSLRADLPFDPGTLELGRALSASLGGFGLFRLDDYSSLSMRHEALIRPWHSWSPRALARTGSGLGAAVESDPDSPVGAAGAGLSYALYTYHEFVFSLPDHVSTSLRAIVSPVDLSCLAIAEADWAPLQGLRLYARVSVQAGQAGDSFEWGDEGSIVAGLGAYVSY